jgi:YHS domain-containing protein
MYSRLVFLRVAGAVALVSIAGLNGVPVRAQSSSSSQPPTTEQHQHPAAAPAQEQGHDQQMAREGSGTAWLPDTTPMYAIHWQRGPWQFMAHENLFIQFLHESGDRGDDQFGSINWVMGMAQRNAGKGRVTFRGMFSAEPWTISGCGYPDLLASGERCDGEQLHDRQHPHDLLMEISAQYDAPLKGPVRWQVYGGPAGEPALGPVAYPHRVSAMPNPLAPISHHWLDATHITFGVVSAGIYTNRWKAEASVFNGREPDEERADFDFGALDSFSGRLWFLPTPKLALQISAGKLTEAEASDDGGPGTDVNRVTGSATYHSAVRDNSIWATTIAWGRNEESGVATNAFLIETNLTLDERNSWFGRFEVATKSAHDLAVEETADASTVAKLQGGYTRYLSAWRGFKPGVGASVSAGFVPAGLEPAYGGRVNAGFGVFVTLRPATMMMHEARGAAPAPVEHPQHAVPQPAPRAKPGAPNQPAAPREPPPGEPRLPVNEAERVIDPACAATIDLVKAPRATYQRRVYYFCSVSDRDEFVKDPAAYLKKRGK